MKPRTIIKSNVNEKLVLKRITPSTRQFLTLNLERCMRCDICEKICPEKAINKPFPATLHDDGRLAKKALIDIDANKCTLCGVCVVLCPVNAFKIEMNGKERIPVVEVEAFPTLIKEIKVAVNKCNPICNLVCQENCPTKALEVIIEKTGTSEENIFNVEIDKRNCIFCKRCELACPQTAISVTKPIQGIIWLNTNLCSKDCKVCIDTCPSKAITLGENGKPSITEEYCIYCGACKEVCPKKAIVLRRTRVLYSDVRSGAWTKALEKLTSRPSLIKELNAKSMRKLHEAAKNIG